MRTATRLSLFVALLAALFLPTQSGASQSSASAACEASQWIEYYELSLRAEKKVYRLGDSAVIRVEVTNAATGMPEGNVDVAVGAVVGRHYVAEVGRTNAAGAATIELDLEPGPMKPGRAELRGLARTYHDEGDAVCAGIGLYGFERVKDAFTIKR